MPPLWTRRRFLIRTPVLHTLVGPLTVAHLVSTAIPTGMSYYPSLLSAHEQKANGSFSDSRSDPTWEFAVVHNGIITNYKELKSLLESKGFKFETETDTEAIAKLALYIYKQHPDIEFPVLAKAVIKELEGAFGLLLKSVHYPNEVIAARKGSPLVIGVKSAKKMKVDFVDVEYSEEGALPAERASQNLAVRKAGN